MPGQPNAALGSTPAPDGAPAAPRPDRVGHYVVLSELGRGGMGVVYRARDVNLGREVALKSPLAGRANDVDSARLVREARAICRLSHPNIVPIFEILEEAGQPWLAMQLIDGQTLRSWIRDRGALPVSDVVRHAEGLAGALQAAHEKGILHRDVTPANVMVTKDGLALLMDFGLAQAIQPSETDSTESSLHLLAPERGGTVGYVSPEQALGHPVDARSDLFSLGVVMYEMCTGTQAFKGKSNVEVMDATLHRDPVAMRKLRPEVPAELERIVRKAMAKRADERYQDALDLVADVRTLRRTLESHPERQPSSEIVRPREWRRVAAGIAVAVLILAAVAIWRSGGQRSMPAGVPLQVTSAAGWEAEPALSPDGTQLAYSSDESGNPDIWIVDAKGGTPLRLTNDPASDRNPAWLPDGSAVAFVSTRDGVSSIWKLPRLGGNATMLVPNAVDPAISPDGQHITFARLDRAGSHQIGVARLDDLAQIQLLTSEPEGLFDHRYPAWSPDGRTICYAAQRDLWVVPAAGGAASRLTADGEIDFEPVWSPDARHVYFSSYRQGTSALWRIATPGGPPERLTFGSGPERHPTLSRDGSKLGYSTFVDSADMVLRNLTTGEERRVVGPREEVDPTIAPDGSAIVFASDRWGGRFDLWLQPVEKGVPTGQMRRLTDHSGSVFSPAFSPDAKWIAYGRVTSLRRDIWIMPATGGPATQFTDAIDLDAHPAWSPDATRLAFVSDRQHGRQLWRGQVAEGKPVGAVQALTTGMLKPEAPAWSPDGRRIAFVGYSPSGSREVWIVDANGGEARQVTARARAERVRWLPSGDELLVSAFWGTDDVEVRRISVGGGPALPLTPPLLLGRSQDYVAFDLQRDGGILVFARQELKGDLWILQAPVGAY